MSLKAKLLVMSAGLTLIPLGVVSYLGIGYFTRDKEQFVGLLGSEVTPVVAREVAASLAGLEARLEILADIASTAGLREAARREAAGRAFRGSGFIAVSIERGGQSLLTLYDDAALPSGDDRQVVLDALPPASVPRPGEVLVHNVTRTDRLPVARIVLTPARSPDLTASALVRPSSLLGSAAASTFDTYVVDSDGRMLVHTDLDHVLARRDAGEVLAVRRIREGLTGAESYSGLDGHEVLGSYAPVGKGNLGVVQELPTEAVYGAVSALVRNVALTVALVLVLALIAAFLLARGIAEPVTQLAQSARVIGEGRFDAEVPAVGGGEVGELAEAFRSMQRGLAERDERLKATQEALVQSEKMGALGQLAAGITHEVKNPMAGIIGFAQLCLKLAPADSPLRKHLEMIEKESKRAKGILENLLKFARREEVEMIALDPNAVLSETVKLVTHQLQINKVQIEQRYGESLPEVMGNMNQLQQVLMNLMMNGMHAMQPKGGHLEVSTSRAGTGHVVLEVKDQGHGISEENRKRLFTPFFTTKEKGKGTGLGLSVSYGIVQQHQGQIRVWSQQGVGTIFYIYLPPATAFRSGPVAA